MAPQKTSPTASHEKIVWIELLRIVSIFAVIVLHTAASCINNQEIIYTPKWIWFDIYHTVTRFGVGCFVMISGALFLDDRKLLTISDIIKKYVMKVVILFLFWSTIYQLVDVIIKYKADKSISIKELIYNILTTSGHSHLWFLLMIAGLYLIIPFVRQFIMDRVLTEYFLTLTAVMYFLPNMLQIFPEVYDLYQTIVGRLMYFNFTFGFVGYFVLGYYLNTYVLSKNIRKIISILGILGILYGIIMGIIYSRYVGHRNQFAYNNNTLNIVLYGSTIFLFFKYKLANSNSILKHKDKILSLGKYTLGIYVIHNLWLDRIAKVFFEWVNYNYAFVFVPVIAVAAFILSLFTTWILKKLPLPIPL